MNSMIIQSNQFDIQQIADSGQCFRMNPIGHGRYALVAYGNYLELTQLDSKTVELSCDADEFDCLWKAYFDLEYDYGALVDRLEQGKDPFLREAARFGHGLRILHQEPFETLVSFLLSQNKNIPAIKATVEQLCQLYGEAKVWTDPKSGRVVSYYAFPKPSSLAMADPQDLRRTGMGYRDAYILKTAQAVVSGELDLNALQSGGPEESKERLKGLYGVGDKVANCVCLFGLHQLNVCPVDVWIDRVLREVYSGAFDWTPYQDVAGIVQQYMFYYIRRKTTAHSQQSNQQKGNSPCTTSNL